MKKRILDRFMESMDERQLEQDVNDASRELSAFVSSFDFTDLPVTVFLMQSYAKAILDMDSRIPAIAEFLESSFGQVLFTIPVKKDGGANRGV